MYIWYKHVEYFNFIRAGEGAFVCYYPNQRNSNGIHGYTSFWIVPGTLNVED